MGKLKALHRRWLLFWQGECEWEGCTDPPRGFPMKFEHEVQVQAEALRRVLPQELQGKGS